MAPFIDIVGALDKSAQGSIYKQLQSKIRNAIENNHLLVEALLPAERELAHMFQISRITVRKALAGLVDEGLLTRKQGAGTFVSMRVEKNFSQLTSFSEDMVLRGCVPSSKWLGKTLGSVTAEEVMNYGLSPDLKVYRLDRLRFADGVPMALEYTIIPASCLSSIDDVQSSLYEALEQNGYRPRRALQRLRAVLLSEEQAQLLDAKPNDAGLLVERRGFLQGGRIIEIAHTYYRGAMYDIVSELSG